MTTLHEFAFGAFVVDAGFVGGEAAFALGDGTIRFAKARGVDSHPVHGGAILRAVTTLDGRRLITGGDDGRLAATNSDGLSETLASHPKKWINELAAGPSGAVAYSVGRDILVRAAEGEERRFAFPRAIGGVAFAPKGLRIGVARYDGVTLRFVATDAPGLDLTWKGAHIGIVFSPDGRYVVTSMQENALHGWRLGDGLNLRMTGYPAKPRSLSWSPKGRFLATSGSDAAVLWPFHFKDGPQGKEPTQIGARPALVTKVACHPRLDILAIGYQDGAVALAPIGGGAATELVGGNGSPVSALGWDEKGKRLIAGTEAGEAALAEISL